MAWFKRMVLQPIAAAPRRPRLQNKKFWPIVVVTARPSQRAIYVPAFAAKFLGGPFALLRAYGSALA